MTTVDEAKAFFAHWREIMTPEERAASDVLLSSYDEMKGRIEEAVRLMEPFARFFKSENHDLSPAKDTTLVATFQGEDGHALADIWIGDFRALASFVSREKVDGGARG